MYLFNVTEFDPLNLSSAESYVQSVMGPQKVNEIVTTADVHAEKPVSNFNTLLLSTISTLIRVNGYIE